MKKAQIAGQIFIYIIAVVVVGLIIAYGYSAIKGFSKKGEQVEYITLKSNIENSVKSIVSDYGSIKRPDIDVPGKYKLVCFVDKEKYDANSAICKETSSLEDYHQPIVCSGWEIGRDNVYLTPDGSDSFDVGEIVIENKDAFMCFEVVNNKIKLQLTGLGDKVEVSGYS
jgi:hypothetical protein